MPHATYTYAPAESAQGWLRRAETWLDDKGKGAWIAVMVLSFIFVWPVGLALLAYMIWSKRMFACKHRPHHGPRGRHMQRARAYTAHAAARPSGFRTSRTSSRPSSNVCARRKTRPSSTSSWKTAPNAPPKDTTRQRSKRRMPVRLRGPEPQDKSCDTRGACLFPLEKRECAA